MAFEKIETKRKHVYIAEQILRAIKEGIYQVGDKLPPERELAEQMGVSRNSVREALSALQVLNVIESRTGNGSYIKRSVENVDIESQVLAVLEESESPFKIFEARRALELGVLEVAIENADAEDIKRVEEALSQMQDYASIRDYNGYLEANLKFHLAMAKATKNPIVESAMRALWETTSQRLLNEMVIDYWRKHLKESVEIHKQILTAIKKRDKENAGKVIKRHYNEAWEHFLKYKGKRR